MYNSIAMYCLLNWLRGIYWYVLFKLMFCKFWKITKYKWKYLIKFNGKYIRFLIFKSFLWNNITLRLQYLQLDATLIIYLSINVEYISIHQWLLKIILIKRDM